jgi:hypothetical protein
MEEGVGENENLLKRDSSVEECFSCFEMEVRGCEYCKFYGPLDSRGLIYTKFSRMSLHTTNRLFVPPAK